MNYRNIVMSIRGLRLLACLGLSSFIALTSDGYRLNFNPSYSALVRCINTKYEYAIKPVFNPDITLQSEEAIAT